MDILASIKNDPGALLVGALWGVFMIYNHVRQGFRDTRKQSEVDTETTSLVKSLREDRDEANRQTQQEQARADRLARENMDLSIELGGLRADLRHSTAARSDLSEKLERATSHVEQLVVENRNKDRSITKLVDVNRQILRSIGSSIDVPEGTQEKQP